MGLYKILINNMDYTPYIVKESINITDSNSVRSDSMNFSTDIEYFSVTPPKTGNEIEFRNYLDAFPNTYFSNGIYDITDIMFDTEAWTAGSPADQCWYIKEFAGMILTVTRKWVGPPLWIRYDYGCQDYTRQFDRYLVNKVYGPGSEAATLVNDIVHNYCPSDFTTMHVNTSARVPEMTFDFTEPSSCIQELAECVGFQWYIDFNKDVHFFWSESFKSPFSIANAQNTFYIDSELEYAYNLEITEDASQIKNKILVKNVNFMGDQVSEDFVAAQDKFYKIFYESYPAFDVGTEQAVRSTYVTVEIYNIVDGNYVLDTTRPITTVLLDEVEGKAGDGQGDQYTVYINFEKGIRFPDSHPLGTDQVVRIYYNKVENVPIIDSDPSSIEETMNREGGVSDGIYEYPYDASAIYTENGEEVSAAAGRVLLRYKNPLITGSFQSRIMGWRAGQFFTIYSMRLGSSKTEPLEEIVWIRDVTKSVLENDIIEYTVSFSSSPFGD